MNLNIYKYGTSLSYLGFVLCFLFFLIYHLGIYNNYWSNFIPGFFGLTTLLVFFFYCLFFRKIISIMGRQNNFIFILSFILLIYTLVVTFLNYNNIAFYQSIEFILMFVTFFILGFYLSNNNFNKNILYLISLILVFILILSASIFKGKYTLFTEEENEASGYQTLARNFLTYFLLVYSIYYNSKFRDFIYLIIIIGLFLIGARSELIVFLLVSFLYIILEAIRYKRYKSFYLILIFFLVCLNQLDFNSISSRQLQIIDFENSSSWMARQELNSNALDTIKEYYILGNFGSHAIYDNVGRYAHNILSGYVNYGLFFFIVYLLIYLLILIKAIKLYLFYDLPIVKYSLLINFICFTLVLSAKPVFWPIFYLGWGVTLGAAYSVKIYKENI